MATTADTGSAGRVPAMAWWTLALMLGANTLNYLDRQIVSILAQAIKADLKLDDAELGFLLGTAFAVFYSVVGIAMGRISDFVPRKTMMALGLSFWSAMTALGGLASNFALLATARIGVGVGEAVANPCGHSLVADVFPQRIRALTLSVLLAGTFIGTAGAMVLGGWFLDNWGDVCGSFAFGPGCALPAWKAALIAVGLPGIPLALLLLTIREPNRDRGTTKGAGFMLGEFAAAFPPFTLGVVYRLAGRAGLMRNLFHAGLIALVCAAIAWLTGDKAQWAALGLGAYAVVTWGQVQSYRDRPLHALTFGDPTFRTGVAATALIASLGGTIHVWSAPYMMRTFEMSHTEVGAWLGGLGISGGLIGVILGGWITDRWKQRDLRAPVGIGAVTVLGVVPSILFMLSATSPAQFLAGSFATSVFGALWSGSTAAMVQDLVLPRMRGAASAAYSLIAIVVASGFGPYLAGKASVLTGSLNSGLYVILLLAPLALLLLWRTARRMPHETPEARLARAVAAGEPLTRP